MKKVCIYGSFDTLPQSYAELFGDTGSASNVFLTLPWFRHLGATVLEKTSDLRIYGVESDDEHVRPHLALPMCCNALAKRVFAPRRLTSAANYYTSLFGPILEAKDSCASDELILLAQAIAAEQPCWDMIDLHPMNPDAAVFADTLVAFRQAGMAAQSYFCFGNWYLQVNGRSYQEYFDALPSRLKNTLERKRKQLANAGRLHIEIFQGDDDLDRAIAAYEKIYTSSWKEPEPYPAFMPGLIRSCAQQGWLRMGVAHVDGQAAAAQVWIVYNGVASIYKLAYDEQFAKLSIGSILTARLMQHAIDVDRVREVDYLTGDEAYKREWMSHRRERRGIVAFNLRSMNGAFAALKHFGGRVLKSKISDRI